MKIAYVSTFYFYNKMFFWFNKLFVLFIALAFWGAKSRFHVEHEGKESTKKAVIFGKNLRTKITIATH